LLNLCQTMYPINCPHFPRFPPFFLLSFASGKISASGYNSGVKATVTANAALDRENLDTEEEHQMVFFLMLRCIFSLFPLAFLPFPLYGGKVFHFLFIPFSFSPVHLLLPYTLKPKEFDQSTFIFLFSSVHGFTRMWGLDGGEVACARSTGFSFLPWRLSSPLPLSC
jgi:hypothetical protein